MTVTIDELKKRQKKNVLNPGHSNIEGNKCTDKLPEQISNLNNSLAEDIP